MLQLDTPAKYPPFTQPRPVRHDRFAGCGERMACPIHGLPWGPLYRPAERLVNGTIVAHDCGQSFRSSDVPA